MDDLYGNAWGDPIADYPPEPTYPPPTWSAQPQPPSPQQPPPTEDDQNDDNMNDEETSEDPTTEPQFRTGALDTSWTTDAVPWPVEESQNHYPSAWTPVPPADAWSSTAQPQTPTVPTPAPPDDTPPNYSPPPSPSSPAEPKKEHLVLPEHPQDTPVQSRVPSPDQFGTFESGNLDATISVEEGGWGSPKYSTFDDTVDSSNAWGQQATTKERDTEAEPADEWEAARRMKEKLDRTVVSTPSCTLVQIAS